ncbi:DUF222 domain-containing protein [Microbacterium sp. zg-YB36]|nr:HNH endonuclease signature motif containing protein [Microbacterium sp. zg-YB36]MDL5352114.1 DUF222 domain-containing protein [Microbacterium sp. zg-YB36]
MRITDLEVRARFEQAALAVCEIETPGRAKPSIEVIAQKLHPIPLDERHAEAAAGRRVWVRDLDDGMAEITAALPAPLVYAIQDRLSQYACEITAAHREAAKTAEAADGTEINTTAEIVATDTRTMDQIRADVFADLLLTGHATAPISNGSIPETAAIVAQVQIIVPADTLTGRGTDPAELVGYGPIDPETARRLAATAEVWERVFTCPVTGAVEEVDTYRPSRAQRRHLDARDEHCRFPGCRRPARRCDHDHTIDAARGGPTALCNLANLCTRHHSMKHATAWTVVQKAHGILEWTSPTGRVFPDIPPPGPGIHRARRRRGCRTGTVLAPPARAATRRRRLGAGARPGRWCTMSSRDGPSGPAGRSIP